MAGDAPYTDETERRALKLSPGGTPPLRSTSHWKCARETFFFCLSYGSSSVTVGAHHLWSRSRRRDADFNPLVMA